MSILEQIELWYATTGAKYADQEVRELLNDATEEIIHLQQRVKTLEFGGEMILGIADSSRDTVKWALERLKEQDSEKDAKIETLSKAVDSWKACNTAARQELDEARDAARQIFDVLSLPDPELPKNVFLILVEKWPWLEEDNHKDV